MYIKKLLILILLISYVDATSQEQKKTFEEIQHSLQNLDTSNLYTINVDQTLQPISDTIVPIGIKKPVTYPSPFKNYQRLGYTTAMCLGATGVIFAKVWFTPESRSRWDKKLVREKGIFYSWRHNVSRGTVADNDNFYYNWVTHPYFGGVYYMTARSSGFTVMESLGYSALVSAVFWEFGAEAFVERPSSTDLIITPLMGTLVGELFFVSKKSIMKHDKKILKSKFLGYTAMFIMDPFNTFLDSFFGYKDKVKTQMNLAPVGINQLNKKPTWGITFSHTF